MKLEGGLCGQNIMSQINILEESLLCLRTVGSDPLKNKFNTAVFWNKICWQQLVSLSLFLGVNVRTYWNSFEEKDD